MKIKSLYDIILVGKENTLDTKKKNKNNGQKDHNVAGILCIIISLFFLICLSTPLLSDIGIFIRNLTMGLFGYLSFPVILCTLFLGILLLMNKKAVLSFKQITFIALIAVCAVFILHTAIDSSKLLSDDFGTYIGSLINFNNTNTLADYSVGGVVFGIFVYGIKSILSIVGAYILYSILLILFCGLLIYDFRQDQKRIIEENAKKNPRFISFEKGKSSPRPVREGYDPTLYVGTIEHTKKTVVQNGDFSSINDGSYSNMPLSETISHFDTAPNNDRYNNESDRYNGKYNDDRYSYDSGYNGSSYAEKDEYNDESLHDSAMKRLFGNPDEVYRNYEEQLRKNMDIRDKSMRTDVTTNDDAKILSKPQPVSLYPSIDREPNRNQADKTVKYVLPEIPFLPEKDVSDQIVDGPILNGDEISKTIKDNQKHESEQADQIKDDNSTVEEETPELPPIIVGNPKLQKEEISDDDQDVKEEEKDDEPEIEQMPILNGDNFTKKEENTEHKLQHDFWAVRFGGIFKDQINDEKDTSEKEVDNESNDAERSLLDNENNTSEKIEDDGNLQNDNARFSENNEIVNEKQDEQFEKADIGSEDNEFTLNIDDEISLEDDNIKNDIDAQEDDKKIEQEQLKDDSTSEEYGDIDSDNDDTTPNFDVEQEQIETNVETDSDYDIEENNGEILNEEEVNISDDGDNAISDNEGENKDELASDKETAIGDNGDSFDDKVIDAKIPDSLKMVDNAIDMSETSDEIDNDNTGYYTTEKDFERTVGEISLKLNDDKFGLNNTSGVNNQINMDDYDVEIKNDKPKKIKKHLKYTPPPLDLLVTNSTQSEDDEDYEQNARNLEEVLHNLKVDAKVVTITRGPAVTRYELEVALGQSVKSIPNRAEDIAYSLASNGSVRIEAPITGKRAVGVEVPNKKVSIVSLKDIIDSEEFAQSKSCLTMALGKDISGKIILCNLEKMPHLLIAGATGSGKSACLNSIIASFLYKASPEDVRLILIDPKQVEFVLYRNMPHLLMKNIINDSTQAINAFKWARTEMDRRYTLFAKYAVRNLSDFNECSAVVNGIEPKLPRIVIIVDELAELMISKNAKELEQNIMSMAQKARAAGMHLILATQRPSVDVLTGTIKANFTSRIAFAVKGQADSRTILDFAGAETLLGNGDMLYAPLGAKEQRVQGAFITTEEVENIVNFVKENNDVDFDEDAENIIMKKPEENAPTAMEEEKSNESAEDPLMKEVLKKVIETHQASASQIQRRFSVGYNRAARLIDQMEERGYIGPLDGSKPREVKITREKFIEIYGEDIS